MQVNRWLSATLLESQSTESALPLEACPDASSRHHTLLISSAANSSSCQAPSMHAGCSGRLGEPKFGPTPAIDSSNIGTSCCGALPTAANDVHCEDAGAARPDDTSAVSSSGAEQGWNSSEPQFGCFVAKAPSTVAVARALKALLGESTSSTAQVSVSSTGGDRNNTHKEGMLHSYCREL